jgi:hypothetical protein
MHLAAQRFDNATAYSRTAAKAPESIQAGQRFKDGQASGGFDQV